MALPMTIPSWLSVHPTDYVQAAQAGLQSGLAAARMYQQAQEDSARLAQAEKFHSMESAAKSELADREYIMQQQKDMTDAAYKQQLISQKKDELKQSAAEAAERARASIEHYKTMQQAAMLKAQIDQARLDQPESPKLFNRKEGIISVPPGGSPQQIYKAPQAEDAMAALTTAPPPAPGLLDRIGSLFKGAPTAAPATAVAAQKAQRANILANENPDWSKEQIIKAVNDEFSTPIADQEPSSDDEQ